MGRKRQPSPYDELIEILKHTPFWVGPVLAVIAFVGIRFVVPHLFPGPRDGTDPSIVLRQMVPFFAWGVSGLILVAWLWAEIAKLFNRRLFDRTNDLGSIRQLSWHDFERFVTESFRRQGYLAEHVGSPGGDGGIDILLHGHGEKIFVQCKQWNASKVGISPVRELLGVVVSENAKRGILVTSGRFTSEAIRFAEQNVSLELIDGTALEAMIAEIQTDTKPLPAAPPEASRPSAAKAPHCPSCGIEMVPRIVRKGAGAGSKFWGCQKYPACKGTRPA